MGIDCNAGKLQFDRWSIQTHSINMFKYYIESMETEHDKQEDNNHRSETLLLASSRSHSNHHQNYQHSHMFREDYQGLFYRKLNAIIHLESLQQVLQQNESVLGQLSSTCLNQIVAKRDLKSLDCSQFKRESECGVVLMAREMVLLHSKVRRQWVLLRKKAELEHEVTKITIDKKSLIEQIKIFGHKLGEILLQNFNQTSCIDIQKALLQHARKYNLSKVITNFMQQLKSTIVGSQINQMVNTLLKCSSSEDLKSSIKIEELKLFSNPYKNRKELINNLTLYLKEFYSTNIYKEFTDIISRLTKEYELAKFKSNYLTNKLSDEIGDNVKLLRRVLKEITNKGGQIMDYKIDIEILTEQIKLIQKNIWIAEQSMAEYIHKETELLLKQYLIHQGKLFRQDITDKLTEMADYKYFNQQLTSKYKQFLVEHLRKAQEIEKMKEKIEMYNLTLASYEKQLKMHISPEQSQVFTYRTTANQKRELMSKVSCEDEVFEQQIEEQNEQQYPQKQQQNQFEQNQLQSHRGESDHSIDKQNNNGHLQQEQHVLKQLDYNTLSPQRQPKKNQYQSCGQMALKMTALLNQCQRKQKFLVKKVVNIGCKSIQPQTQFKKHKPTNSKEYQAKLTKKYLILQPINQQILSICEKIEWSQIKKYTPNYHTATLILEYGGCRVLLNFVTFNMDIFVKRMEKVHRPVNRA